MSVENTHHVKLFSKDRSGTLRHWWIESTSDGQWRTHAGQIDGALVTSGWKQIEIKNVGRSNETTLEEQISKEVAASYEKRTYGGHYAYEVEHLDLEKPYFSPMLAETYSPEIHTFDETHYTQPKLDGIRCIARADGLWTRNGKPISTANHILDSYKLVFDKWPDLVIDGELYNHKFHDEFDALISLIRKDVNVQDEDIIKARKYLQHWIYDCYLASEPDMPFEERSELLKEFISMIVPQEDIEKVDEVDPFSMLYENTTFENHIPVVLVPTETVKSEEDLIHHFRIWMNAGYEGSMLRLKGSVYEPKRRSKFLLKVKEFMEEDFEIVSVTSGKGNWAGKAKSFEIRNPKTGIISKSGVRGTEAFLKKILEESEKYIGTLASCRFQGYTKSGKCRFGVIVKFWGTEEREL